MSVLAPPASGLEPHLFQPDGALSSKDLRWALMVEAARLYRIRRGERAKVDGGVLMRFHATGQPGRPPDGIRYEYDHRGQRVHGVGWVPVREATPREREKIDATIRVRLVLDRKFLAAWRSRPSRPTGRYTLCDESEGFKEPTLVHEYQEPLSVRGPYTAERFRAWFKQFPHVHGVLFVHPDGRQRCVLYREDVAHVPSDDARADDGDRERRQPAPPRGSAAADGAAGRVREAGSRRGRRDERAGGEAGTAAGSGNGSAGRRGSGDAGRAAASQAQGVTTRDA